MFYSQFILAKKGPLGTIWIAAHLERKLRKNQVADTDIGDSVDSILFPDVPIALRLSSHLLLGVVRIYSRKVNYLFHDCSEALLKVKQAFRSTVVDLPPEESTAPYHSITLPETFDLDDFELPDSALLSGNFDDRHVSTREQITLQDTLDGAGYSTSQFGLDEQFGDGDASQIRLDLDEELFFDNNLTVQHASVSLVSEKSEHQGQDAGNLTKMDVDEDSHGYNEDRDNKASKNLSEVLFDDRGKHIVSNVDNLNKNDSSHRLIFNIQTPDLNEVFLPEDDARGPSALSHDIDLDPAGFDPASPEFNESANFPSTPGLLEEALPTRAQELPVSDSQKISQYADLEGNKLDKPTNQEVELPDAADHELMHVASSSPKPNNLAQSACSLTSVLAESKPDAEAPQNSGGFLPSLDPINEHGHAQDESEPVGSCHIAPGMPTPLSVSTDITMDLRASQLGGASLETINDRSLVHVESENPRLEDIPHVLPSSTLVETEAAPDYVVTKSLDETTAVPAVVISESTVKTPDTLHNIFTFDETTAAPAVKTPHVLPSSTLVETEAAPDYVVTKSLDETTAAPAVVISESTVKTPDTLHNIFTFNELNKRPSSVENSLVSEVSSGNYGISLENSTRLSTLDEGHLNDSNSCDKTNLSALGSSFHLRSCTSESNQTSLISPGVIGITESAPMISFRDSSCNLATPLAGQELNYSGFSVGLQGGNFNSAFTTDANTVMRHNSNSVFLGSMSHVTNPLDLSSNYTTNIQSMSHVNNPQDLSSNYMTNIQSGHMNCFSSSEFSGPERMLFAPSGNLNLLNDVGLQSTEKGVIESDGSVDIISSLSGHKRRLADSPLDLQNGLTPEISAMPRKRRSNDYVPNDDDILASILVGRTPALRMGLTPPVPKPATLKRPRLTPKVGLPKRRKVQLDDNVVLHADAIRQQLLNTEDIRRMRKKAPCTLPEIWRIHISLLENDIFCESIFTGISEELNSSVTRKYDFSQNLYSQINERQSSVDVSKGPEHFRTAEFVRDNNDRETAVQSEVMLDRVGVQGQFNTSAPIGTQSCQNTATQGAQERLESPLSLNQKEQSGNADAIAEPDVLRSSEVELVTHVASNSGVECNVQTDARIDEKCDDRGICPEQNSLNELFQIYHEHSEINTNLHVADCTSEDLTSVDQAGGGKVLSENELAATNNDSSVRVEDLSSATAKDASLAVEDVSVDPANQANLDNPEDVPAGVAVDNDASMLDRSVVEVGAELPADSSTIIQYTDPSVSGVTVSGGEPTTIDCQDLKESEGGQIMADYATIIDVEKPTSESPCMEGPHMPSFPIPPTTEHVPSAVDENSSMNIEGGLDVESTHMEFAATRESSDFCSAIDDIDTDFLNVDDDVEYDEETNDDVTNTEEAQSLENMGWSSRTRGVAKYLKNLFDEESGRSRKSVAIDNLLVGKTRREASRMFFETLVLKTKDYIHVEQENPLEYINIKPRMKLLKSEF